MLTTLAVDVRGGKSNFRPVLGQRLHRPGGSLGRLNQAHCRWFGQTRGENFEAGRNASTSSANSGTLSESVRGALVSTTAREASTLEVRRAFILPFREFLRQASVGSTI